MISEATEHYAVELPLPERLSSAKLRELQMPVYPAWRIRALRREILGRRLPAPS
jgi:hypothetical protein